MFIKNSPLQSDLVNVLFAHSKPYVINMWLSSTPIDLWNTVLTYIKLFPPISN